MSVVKKWALPLGRTFLAAAVPIWVASLTAVQAGGANLGQLSFWWGLIGGGVAAGVNAVILAVQHVTPVLPPVVNPSVPANAD